MNRQKQKRNVRRHKRAMRVRRKLTTNGRPRLSVHKSNQHLSVQIIDDETGSTLAAISTNSKELRGTDFSRRNRLSARKLGERIAEMAKEKNITELVFDRGRFKYHGVLAELADSARAAGLRF